MILFKPEHVPMILDGRKTQTRRLATSDRPRWKVGAVHQCFTTPPFARARFDPPKPFARVLITGVRRELLCNVSADDVTREGYKTRYDYLLAFERINRNKRVDATAEVWVVDFKLDAATAAIDGGEGR